MFDTTTVVSALVFANRRLSWLLPHWQEAGCTPLISPATATETDASSSVPEVPTVSGRSAESSWLLFALLRDRRTSDALPSNLSG